MNVAAQRVQLVGVRQWYGYFFSSGFKLVQLSQLGVVVFAGNAYFNVSQLAIPLKDA